MHFVQSDRGGAPAPRPVRRGVPRRGGVAVFGALGRFVSRHPWYVIVGWVVVAAAVIATAPKLTSTTDEAQFLPGHYESIKALQLQAKAYPGSNQTGAIIVFDRRDGAALTDADVAAVKQAVGTLGGRLQKPFVGAQAQPPSQNRLVEVAGVGLQQGANPYDPAAMDAVKALRSDLGKRSSPGNGPARRGDRGGRPEPRLPGGLRERRDHRRDRDDRADPGPAAAHLPQPGDRGTADRGDRGGLPGRDRPDRDGQQGLRPAGRQLDPGDPDRGALRHRHRLHPVLHVPLPRTTA